MQQVKQFWDSTTEQQRTELLTLDIDCLNKQAAKLPGTLDKHVDKIFFLQRACDSNKQNCDASLNCNKARHMIAHLHTTFHTTRACIFKHCWEGQKFTTLHSDVDRNTLASTTI